MKRVVVYSHDTYGLGNIRRMSAICRYLLENISDISVLLITGSPVVHTLSLPEQPDSFDYIKLPCLRRVGKDEYAPKYLSKSQVKSKDKDLDAVVKLRSELILTAVKNFAPDLLLIDKKPLGIKGELAATFDYLEENKPDTKNILILRDILDDGTTIRANWDRNGHYTAIEKFYDKVLILGEQRIFDPTIEYAFPASVKEKTEFCGYIRKPVDITVRDRMRHSLGVDDSEKLILVTLGGGEDGFDIAKKYLQIATSTKFDTVKSLVVSGPEMPVKHRVELAEIAGSNQNVIFIEFTGDILSMMSASDVVVSMAGYNTVSEILSLNKPAVIIPRIKPTLEQLMRAEGMRRLGLLNVIHPYEMTAEKMLTTLDKCLYGENKIDVTLDFNALPVIADRVKKILNLNGNSGD